MSLKPQDVLVMLKMALQPDRSWTMAELGQSVGLSASEVHNALRRGRAAGLVNGNEVNRTCLYEFLVHGLKYVYFVERGAMTRGIPTSHAAPPLNQEIRGDAVPPVWPHPDG